MPDDGLFDTRSVGLSDDVWWGPERDARADCVEQSDGGENIGLVASRAGLAVFGWDKWGVGWGWGAPKIRFWGLTASVRTRWGEESGRSIIAPS